MGKAVWIVICLILAGFRVSSLKTDTPSYNESEQAPVFPRQGGGYSTTTVRGKLREDMPELSFDVEARFDEKNSCYRVMSVTVREAEEILQVIMVPELTLFGETALWTDQEESMGLELEDVNFDGYKDIRLFDTPNGNYLLEWIYLVWNPETRQFEHDPRLNEIPLATFDQEDQLIYGMERGGADRHYYFTYQYLDGEPVKIREEWSIYLADPDPEIVKRCLVGTSVDQETVEICRETVWERNSDTEDMELSEDKFVFFAPQATGRTVVTQVQAGSETGRLLSGEEG